MDEGVDPKNLGQQMVTAIDEYAQVESLANPEIRTLFIDWMEELEEEILAFYKKNKIVAPNDLAERFKISRQGADFLLEKMKQERKIE
jgi:predicted HTH transcriptional regulator